MRAALAGDERAYHAFLTDVAPHLRAMARRRCDMLGADKSLAEDIVQEVLLSVHLKRGSWDPSRPIGPWLAAITRNRLIDALRRKGRRVDIPIEDVAETLAALDAGDTERDLGDASRLLNRLKDPQRDIVRSISLEGREVRETAARLNMTEGAVRVALHRALKTLAALYRSTVE